jgi:hypothetical protein
LAGDANALQTKGCVESQWLVRNERYGSSMMSK